MREVKDILLDARGDVTANPALAVEMRRTVFEDGRAVEHWVFYPADRPRVEMPADAPPAAVPLSARGWTPARRI